MAQQDNRNTLDGTARDLVRRGAERHQAGAPGAAEDLYRQALAVDGRNADALHLLGVARAQLGHPREGAVLVSRAVAINPNAASYRTNLARILRGAAERPDAVRIFCEAGGAFFDEGDLGHATQALRHALSLSPADITALHDLASATNRLGQAGTACALADRLRRLDPGLIEGHLIAGAARKAAGDLDGAANALADALRLRPQDAAIRTERANALKIAGRMGTAEAEYRRAAALDPGLHTAQFNLGVTLADLGRARDSIAPYRRAAALRPDHAATRFNLGAQLLKAGVWPDCWIENEWRFAYGVPLPDYGIPRWSGEPLEGRRLLLWSEAGQGDGIQIVRIARRLAAMGARVGVSCSPSLVRLFDSVPGVSQAMTEDGVESGAWDFWSPTYSVPAILRLTMDQIPQDFPYVGDRFPGDERFDPHFAEGDALRVGLVWSGERYTAGTGYASMNQRRSMGFDVMEPLLDTPGARFHSLQMGGAAAEAAVAVAAGRLTDPMAQVRDFADTAGLIRRLDLVISVDTSTAHLAGALDKPVWLLSRLDGCCRWMEPMESTPWYRSMRLFHQTVRDDWHEVIERVAAELARTIKSRNRCCHPGEEAQGRKGSARTWPFSGTGTP
ncbi:tetratricopeptide repeat protein [Roseomonas genomospecies 6]|uniref:Tetratricopeptide repeat protein n=1 Tax=Roseomonas genomospecies 6 TaxID=214106 RepID=A0A9W7NH70_9PROT|nr:tetratricopeptide repeat protein [Roseomonas genomospecies 6]KAA0678568.1 hypothetical protein DS843_19260 [Roseomonas genomospecies 6]